MATLNLSIIGPSGAGKGTHAASLCTRFQLRQVSTGDLFRENLQSRSALGLVARKYMEHGDLVPDEVVDAMIEEWCYRLPLDQGALFDGFPRTIDQVHFLDELLQRIDRQLDAVVYLHLPDEHVVERLAGRSICRRCQTPYHDTFNPPARPAVCDRCGGEVYHRPDDTPELVRARLRVFHRATDLVLDHYAAAGKLLIVSGEGTITGVDERLVRSIEAVRTESATYSTVEERARLPQVPSAGMVPPELAHKTIDLVLLGGPGSGKGTQAELLSRRLQLPHIATGDLFRENLKRETDLGKLAKTYMERGELVPDAITDAMVAERLARSDAQPGFILDGFPRTLHQAHALTDLMARMRRRLATVLYIHVPDEEIVRRLSGRLICRNCQSPYHTLFNPPKKPGVCDRCGGELYQRSDDTPSTVRARLATFHDQTEPLIAFYREAGLLQQIEGVGELAHVRDRSLAALARAVDLPEPPAGEDI